MQNIFLDCCRKTQNDLDQNIFGELELSGFALVGCVAVGSASRRAINHFLSGTQLGLNYPEFKNATLKVQSAVLYCVILSQNKNIPLHAHPIW